MIGHLVGFMVREPNAADYATSSGVESLTSWSSLGAMLTNYTARAIYALPIAGYIILYSDYFQTLFKFTVLSSSWGFLSFISRINMIYHGSLILLLAYGLFWWYSPPLLQNKRDRQHFVTDIVVSRDRSTVLHIVRSSTQYLEPLPFPRGEALEALLDIMKRRTTQIGSNAGEYEDIIPSILTFYYNWQNFTRPKLRTLIFCLTGIGYILLILPAFDLFLRVLSTDVRTLFG
jgi:hypothetical protein